MGSRFPCPENKLKITLDYCGRVLYNISHNHRKAIAMGYGQYTTAERRNRDKGYPEGTKDLKVGRMDFEQIMDDVDERDLLDATTSGHNEITLTYKGGLVVCRVRDTNVVSINNRFVLIDTGGWNTLTTRRHVNDFLAAQSLRIVIRGDKKAGGNFLEGVIEGVEIEGCFARRILIDWVTGDISTDGEVPFADLKGASQ